MRILIADDDGASRCVLQAVLEKEGHEVVALNNGTSALEALQAWDTPPLAILDWMMPGMDGVDILQEIRKTNAGRHLYMIMLTSKQDKADTVEALKSGANDYISKPFDRGELLARVNVGCRIIGLQSALSDKITELANALEQIKSLRGIIPICAWCKKIRDDAGYWQQVETYLGQHSEAVFSHGMCPDCHAKILKEGH
ncbi:MAG TPA: response regulator [Verrucomicrobia bacterium]|nr:response regulator [Verrucomicrobiota bacterium]